MNFKYLILIKILFTLSCVSHIEDKKILKQEFKFKKSIHDTAILNKWYNNFLILDLERLDSISIASPINDSLKKRFTSLCVITYDNQINSPKNIEDYNETACEYYVSENDDSTIEFYYSFKSKGWNKLILITFDQLRLPNKNNDLELRLLEEKVMYVDSVYVK